MKVDAGPIRVLRIINRFNLGGPTFNVAYLTRYLDDRYETKLLGGEIDETEASSSFILEPMGIKPVIISEMQRSISPMNDYKAYKEIAKVIKEYRPHIVHTHASKSGTLGRLAAINNGVPIILHTFHGHVFHSYFGWLKTAFYKAIERWLANRSTCIIAISNVQKRELSKTHNIAPENKIEVVPLGFDLSRFNTDQSSKREAFRSRYGLSDQDVAIGIVGRLVPVKNHCMFLKSVKTVCAAHKHTRFFIIGDGESAEALTRYCDDQSSSYVWKASPSERNPLCFTSWIKEIDVVMAGLDIVTLTSFNEGTPVSLIEAQSAGKPVVSTRVGGISDIVNEGRSAFLCDVDDQEAFNEGLDRLITDAALRSEMGQIGRETVNQRFTYTRLADDMGKLYNRLLKEKHII